VNVARSHVARGAVLAVAVTILSNQPAAAESCTRPADQMALNTRVLQTELMVSALTCKNQNLYNKFVVKYRGALVEQGQSLRAMFDRRHGKAGTKHMNALVTRLANEASQRRLAQRYAFCRQSALLFAKALADEKPDLNGLIEVAAEQGLNGVQRCGPATVVGFSTAAGKSTLDPKVFPKPR
jgi:hypothetical protein